MTLSFGFLRAINIGKRRIAMTDLADALTRAGLTDVETFIASGNFVFSGQGDEATIEAVLEARFGFLAETFVRTGAEVQSLYNQAVPLGSGSGVHAVQVGFMQAPPDEALCAKFASVQNELDQFSFGPREVIWTALDRGTDTPFGKKGMASKAWPACTFRNVKTLGRMLEKWG
jgi:uncharacterized protein (DUF1697 family)